MKDFVANKETVIKSVAKMASDKDVVRSFLKGKTPIETLIQKGIKLGKPI